MSAISGRIDHGCLLLLGFEEPAAVAALLKRSALHIGSGRAAPGQIATNIAFTVEGLRAAGLSDDEVRELPEEFVQGMERRAGLLGDLRDQSSPSLAPAAAQLAPRSERPRHQ